MQYALQDGDAFIGPIGALRPGRGASASILGTVHHCIGGSQV